MQTKEEKPDGADEKANEQGVDEDAPQTLPATEEVPESRQKEPNQKSDPPERAYDQNPENERKHPELGIPDYDRLAEESKKDTVEILDGPLKGLDDPQEWKWDDLIATYPNSEEKIPDYDRLPDNNPSAREIPDYAQESKEESNRVEIPDYNKEDTEKPEHQTESQSKEGPSDGAGNRGKSHEEGGE